MDIEMRAKVSALLEAVVTADDVIRALLVDAAAVDGDIDPRERALLLAAAASLGIEAIALEERLSQQLKAVTAE